MLPVSDIALEGSVANHVQGAGELGRTCWACWCCSRVTRITSILAPAGVPLVVHAPMITDVPIVVAHGDALSVLPRAAISLMPGWCHESARDPRASTAATLYAIDSDSQASSHDGFCSSATCGGTACGL